MKTLIEEKASATPTEDVKSPPKEEDDVEVMSSSEVVKCECCKLKDECTIAYIYLVCGRGTRAV